MVFENFDSELVDKFSFSFLGHIAKMMDVDLPQDPDNDPFREPHCGFSESCS